MAKYIDTATSDLSRKRPVPFTINPKRVEKYGLQQKPRAIVFRNPGVFVKLEELQERSSEILNKYEPTKHPEQSSKRLSPVFQEINKIPMAEIVNYFYSELTPTADGKNFKSPTDGQNIGAFVNDKNLLVINGTNHIPYPDNGKFAYNVYSFVKQELRYKTTKEVLERFKKNYSSVAKALE
jgi:hypothetical protein